MANIIKNLRGFVCDEREKNWSKEYVALELRKHKSNTVIDHPDLSVTTNKLANNSITYEKLSEDVSDFDCFRERVLTVALFDDADLAFHLLELNNSRFAGGECLVDVFVVIGSHVVEAGCVLRTGPFFFKEVHFFGAIDGQFAFSAQRLDDGFLLLHILGIEIFPGNFITDSLESAVGSVDLIGVAGECAAA